MLYLIPDEQRKKIVTEYYARIAEVVSFFLVGIFLMIGILAIPTVLMLQTEVKNSEEKISALESGIAQAKNSNTEVDATRITNKINILKEVYSFDIRKKYIEIRGIIEGVSGAQLTSVTIDSLTKTVNIVTEVQGKEVAKTLVDTLNKSSYKGATFPYSILSQKGTFTFAQNLTYE
jgi:hypothetical protein